MIVETRAVPPFLKNGFVVACEETGQAILIDPGDEVDELLTVVRERSLTVAHILVTHGHMDHVAGITAARKATGAPVSLHRDDLFLYEAAVEQGRMFGYDVVQPGPPDSFLEPNARFSVGRLEVTVLHTPGHSPGGVCFLIGPTGSTEVEVFAGDTLFARSIGRTDLPRGDYKTLMASIRGVLMTLPDELRVHPGHGPATTIGDERRSNPFLRSR
jgi:glyoxylase-like metal-dependent hydrolase (beta-lactamase superfamily II)